MRGSNLCDYADAYIFVKGSIRITGAGDDNAARKLNESNKSEIFKNFAPFTKCIRRINFTKCISRINGTEKDNASDIDIVMPVYNLTGYSNNSSKTSGSLWQYSKDDPNDNITQSESFKSKIKITGKIPADGNAKKMLK